MRQILTALFLLVGTICHGALPSSVDLQYLENKNLLKNPGFENAKSFWTASSAATFTINNTAANVGAGSYSAAFDASAGSQTIISTAVAIPSGLYSKNGLARCNIKTAATDYKLQAYDGTNVLAEQTITGTSAFQTVDVNFIFPSSGNIQLRLISASNAAVLYADECYLGMAQNILSVSQASMYGGVIWPNTTNCQWASTSSGAWGNYSADADCTTPTGSNLIGAASAPASKIPAITFATLPPGEYMFVGTSNFQKQGAATYTCHWRFHDGTNALSGTNEASNSNTGVVASGAVLYGRIRYTTAQSNLTVQVQANGDTADGCDVNAQSTPLNIFVYRFPLDSQQALNLDQQGWYVDAYLAGADYSLGTSSVGSMQGMTNAGITLTKNSGSTNVEVACATTTESSGTTCTAADESNGISFTIPRAGTYEACYQGSHYSAANDISNDFTIFNVVETGNANQTIASEGNTTIQSGHGVSGATHDGTRPFSVCGIFNFSSAGKKTLRLFYTQSVSGTVTSNLVKASGGLFARWIVKPITQSIPMPLVINSVYQPSSGQEVIVRGKVAYSGGVPSVTRQNGSAATTPTDVGTGELNLNFASGTFSGIPSCAITLDGGTGVGFTQEATVGSATSLRVSLRNSSFAAADTDFNFVCVGSR